MLITKTVVMKHSKALHLLITALVVLLTIGLFESCTGCNGPERNPSKPKVKSNRIIRVVSLYGTDDVFLMEVDTLFKPGDILRSSPKDVIIIR